MKKIKILLIFLLVLAIIPISSLSANATTTPNIKSTPTATDIVFGKLFTIGNDINTGNTTTDKLTDGSLVTFEKVGNYKASLTGFWIKLSEANYISKLKVKFENPGNQGFSAYFYNEQGSKIGQRVFGGQILTEQELTVDIDNVSYIFLGKADYDLKVYEINVYGYLSTQPTPSPTPEPTPEPTPTPELPSGDRAILTVTLTTGIEKEFDLPMSEVNTFLGWFDTATGSTRYGIDKHDNNKGPFSKRTEYVVHDKILTFEVSEYTAQ